MRLILTGPSRCGTTITSKLLNKHTNVCMTNEVRTYMFLNKLNYIEALYSNIVNRKGLNIPKSFNVEFLKSIDNTLPLKEKVLLIENEMFKDKYIYFGDKGIFSDSAELLFVNDLEFKLVIIHRDLKDVVRSVKRHYPHSHFGYKSDNVKIIGNIWTNWFLDMEEAGKKYAVDYLIIKFEDYVDNPGLNGIKLNNFLKIDDMDICEKEVISLKNTHTGYYKDININWQKELLPETKNLMERLGYDYK